MARRAKFEITSSDCTVVVTTSFALGLPMNKTWARHNVALSPFDDYNDSGRMLLEALMGDEAYDGWVALSTYNTYKIRLVWGELFEQETMIAVLQHILQQIYGDFQLEVV